ncbi:helix-turn-helix domain-containing protein [Nocardia rhizosphaerihabitans]|uniref:helix-turn-helix domain-containing protein n=1 Tax=Nocardia rhizosphaerihabitans TaxID=1691570 RepID=UPI00367296D3
MPAEFWSHNPLRVALASWHMGSVIEAYRNHPAHGQPLSQIQVAHWLGVSQAQLSRIENGPPPEMLSKLITWATVLRIPPDLLWFKLPNAATVDAVDRQGFLRAAAATAATVMVTPDRLNQMLSETRTAANPSRVGVVEIEQIREAAQLFARWDATYGGGLVRDVVVAQLRVAVAYLRADCSPRDRAALQMSVGSLAHTAAFMAFDACAHRDAESMFALALDCAEESGAVNLRAKILSSMARHAIWTGRNHDGLGYVRRAFTEADQLTATERAMLHTTEARVHAKLGDVSATLNSVAKADRDFSRCVPGDDPAWMRYYDSAQHAGDTGHALFDIAVHGSFVGEARERLSAAVNGHADAAARSRTMSTIKLASLVMATGNSDEALAIAGQAIGRARELKSQRAAEDIAELRRYAHRADVKIPTSSPNA